jgi:hypothetical protein
MASPSAVAPPATLAGPAPVPASSYASVFAPVAPVEPVARWSLATRVAFRWGVVYFTLYSLSNQILNSIFMLPRGVPEIPELGTVPPLRNLTEWVAAHVFGITAPMTINGSGSGDKTFDWVQVCCFLVIATIATIVWSILDRRRDRYVRAYVWFRLFLRFALGSSMLLYGTAKAIPTQMPAVSFTLTRLLQPFGTFSPMGVLWSSIGASTSYEIFTGMVEITAGVLLLIPGVTTLGALVCAVAMTQVFMLNMTYDVPVKLLSFHLLLMCLVLLAPDARRLIDFLVLNRVPGPSTEPPLVRSRRARRIAIAAQLVFGAYLLAMNVQHRMEIYTTIIGSAPKPPLYGIWNIDVMQIDGHTRAPLVTDYDRWRRIVVQNGFPAGTARLSYQRMDATISGFTAKIDEHAKTIALSKAFDKAWSATLTYQRPTADHLILDGTIDKHVLHLDMRLVDPNSFLLLTRGFHWINETPFNR